MVKVNDLKYNYSYINLIINLFIFLARKKIIIIKFKYILNIESKLNNKFKLMIYFTLPLY
jgi:hypothetical protein